MRKTYQLNIEGKNRDRLLDAVKHDIRKYAKRQRRTALPEGVDFWDFDCKFGLSAETAAPVHFGNLIEQIDVATKEGAGALYVEVLPKHGHRKARPAPAAGEEQAQA